MNQDFRRQNIQEAFETMHKASEARERIQALIKEECMEELKAQVTTDVYTLKFSLPVSQDLWKQAIRSAWADMDLRREIWKEVEKQMREQMEDDKKEELMREKQQRDKQRDEQRSPKDASFFFFRDTSSALQGCM